MWTKAPREIGDFAEYYGGSDSLYGVYFGVCKRSKEGGSKKAVLPATVLWCDIDADVNGVKTEKLLDSIGRMPAYLQPSIVVHSGGGVHCYWLLDEPCADTEKVEAANRTIMRVMGGDAVFDVSRVLRLPDTSNNKRGSRLCRVVYCAHHLIFDIDQLVDAFETWDKVLVNGEWFSAGEVPEPEDVKEDEAHKWFAKMRLKQGGSKLPGQLKRLWEERVRDGAPRGYVGVHEATIVSAARLHCAGYDEDTIVARIQEYQRMAPGVDTSGWDWRKEDAKVRQSLRTWGEKWKALKPKKRTA